MIQIMFSYEENLTNTFSIKKSVSVLVLIISGSQSGKEEALTEGKLSVPSQMPIFQRAESLSSYLFLLLLRLEEPQSDQPRLSCLTFACLYLHTSLASHSFTIFTRVAFRGQWFCVFVYFIYSWPDHEEWGKGLANYLYYQELGVLGLYLFLWIFLNNFTLTTFCSFIWNRKSWKVDDCARVGQGNTPDSDVE